jgi:hypothetical protein
VIRLPASKAVLDTIGASKDTIASGFSSSKIQIRTAISTVSEKLWEPERTASERRRTQQQLDLTTRTAFLACPTPYRSVFHVAISTAINQSIKTAPVWQDPLKLFFLGAASISQPLQQNQDSRGLEPCASDWAKYFRNIEAGRRDSTRPLHARGSGPAFRPGVQPMSPGRGRPSPFPRTCPNDLSRELRSWVAHPAQSAPPSVHPPARGVPGIRFPFPRSRRPGDHRPANIHWRNELPRRRDRCRHPVPRKGAAGGGREDSRGSGCKR